MNDKRRILLKFIAIVLTLGLSPGHSFAADPGVTDKEVFIGAHTSELGIFAIYSGIPKAMVAYFDAVNEKGGVEGRKIKFVRMDALTDPAKATQITKQLVEKDGIFAMVGAVGLIHQVVFKYLAEKKVPDLFMTDNLKVYGEPLVKTSIPGQISFLNEVRSYGSYALAHLKGKKACFLITDNAMGEEFLAGFKETIEAGNKSLKENEKITLGPVERSPLLAPQANSQVLNLKRAGCEVVLTSTFGGLCPSAITYATSQAFKPTWIVNAYNNNGKFMDLIPESARDGIVTSASIGFDESFKVAGWNDYKTLMDKNSIPVGRPSAYGYTVAEMFVEGLKRAGKDLTREKLITAIESMNGYKCTLCFNAATISPTQHWMFTEPVLLVSKGGKWIKQ